MYKPIPVKGRVTDFTQYNLQKRILGYWNLPDNNSYAILSVLNNLGFLNSQIGDAISYQQIANGDNDMKAQFEDEFFIVCKIAMIMGGLLPPLKKKLGKEHKKTVKSLKPILSDLQDVLKDIDPCCRPYIEAIFCEQSTNKEAGNMLARLEYITEHLLPVLEESEKYEDFFYRYRGGNGAVQNRRCAVDAIAYSYHRCFYEMPTSSENSNFINYVTAFYDLIGVYDPEIGENASILKDAKESVKKLNKKFKILEK
tara:strand:+ start:1293 stop:2057 length:765 start_codon:yes stop_codon:yes gene_type:complete